MVKKAAKNNSLEGPELLLAWLALALFTLCSACDALLLAYLFQRIATFAWLAAASACLVGVALNLRCLLLSGPAIGMAPIAIATLAPVSLASVFVLAPNTLPWVVALTIALLSCALCAYFAYWFARFSATCHRSAQIAPDAVLVVLGGRIKKGVPTLTIQRRLEVAARLWREKPGRIVLLSGGDTPDGRTTEAQAMSLWLVEVEGVDEAAILLEPRADDTVQNIVFSAELLREKGLETRQFCIVTSSYHLYRALEIARAQGIETIGVSAPVPASSTCQQWCREVMVTCAKRKQGRRS